MRVKQKLHPARKPFKRLYLRTLLWFVGRSIQASVHLDPLIKEELFSLPEEYTFALSVMPDGPRMVIRKSLSGGISYLGRDAGERGIDLDLQVHDIESAMLLLTFRESTAAAAAHDRISMVGDLDHGCTFVRVLDEIEILLLPAFLSKRAVKRYRRPGRLASLRGRLYLRTIIGY